MSGHVPMARYISTPTAFMYGMFGISFHSSSDFGHIALLSFIPGSIGVVTGLHSESLNQLSMSMIYWRCDSFRTRFSQS